MAQRTTYVKCLTKVIVKVKDRKALRTVVYEQKILFLGDLSWDRYEEKKEKI